MGACVTEPTATDASQCWSKIEVHCRWQDFLGSEQRAWLLPDKRCLSRRSIGGGFSTPMPGGVGSLRSKVRRILWVSSRCQNNSLGWVSSWCYNNSSGFHQPLLCRLLHPQCQPLPICSICKAHSIVEDITTSNCIAVINMLMELKGCKAFDLVLLDGSRSAGVDWSWECWDVTSQSALVVYSVRLATNFLAQKGTSISKVVDVLRGTREKKNHEG